MITAVSNSGMKNYHSYVLRCQLLKWAESRPQPRTVKRRELDLNPDCVGKSI